MHAPIAISMQTISPARFTAVRPALIPTVIYGSSPMQLKSVVQKSPVIVKAFEPLQVSPLRMVKLIPQETERVGDICASYMKKKDQTSPAKQQSARQSEKAASFHSNNLNEVTAQGITRDSIIEHPYPNSFYQSGDTSFISQIDTRKGSIAQNTHSQCSPRLPQPRNQEIINKYQRNSSVGSPQKQHPMINQNNVISTVFSTPLRTKGSAITPEELQAKLASCGGEWKDTVEETATCKIFREDFLEQREKDFKRRIENLEMQKEILNNQLKSKDSQIDKEVKVQVELKQKIDSLENTISTIANEKEQIQLHYISEIDRLNKLVESLSRQQVSTTHSPRKN